MAETCTILFVDDDPKAGELFLRFLREGPYRCHVHRHPIEAVRHFDQSGADLVITDLRMPGMPGMELLRRVRERDPDVPVIITTAYASVDGAIDALRLGATDFIKKPYDPEELLLVVDRALERTRLERENRLLRRQLKDERMRYGMIGNSPPMQDVYRMIDKVADVNCSVIIQGESGTGKELAARAIHERGPHRRDPFVVIDCGGISDTLLESELFGHRRGAFTGADRDRTGLLEVAGEGTVFLDEIGNISEAMQMKLLRVLEEGRVTPVGSASSVPVDARFIAATHQDLPTLVAEQRFRHDLYHRLNVVTFRMPPLAERQEDIPALVQHFAAEFAAEYKRPLRHFSADAMRQLCRLDWDGNVRELRNYVQRCVIMADRDELQMVEASGLPKAVPREGSGAGAETLDEMEAQHIQEVLESVGGNQSQAAVLLGISRTTLWRKLRQIRDSAA